MEYLSITIAILSLILSSTQWIYTLYKNRTNFSMSLERFQWYEKPEYDYNQGIFTFMICNLSTAPLTITRMTIKKTSCLITHQWIGDHYYPKFPETDILRQSDSFHQIFQSLLHQMAVDFIQSSSILI